MLKMAVCSFGTEELKLGEKEYGDAVERSEEILVYHSYGREKDFAWSQWEWEGT